MDVEEEVKTASDNRITVEPVKPMSPKEVVACMKLPANAKDKAALEKVILDNITAFSSSDSDLGNFTEWKADLKVKKGSPPAFSKQYPNSCIQC